MFVHVPAAQSTRAESITRKCVIRTDWTVGHGEPLTVSKYQQLYLIVSYKNENVVDIF